MARRRKQITFDDIIDLAAMLPVGQPPTRAYCLSMAT